MGKALKIVIKIEIETLFDDNGILSQAKMENLSMVCANLQNSGVHVMLVSSGAIALGTRRLGMALPPSGITAQQATAAVGQAELIKSYQDCFEDFDQIVAQVLLTKDVIENPLRNINAKNTLNRLLEKGIIPVINENDSVSTQDIILNDNYPMVLIVASLTEADAIVVNTFGGKNYKLILRDDSSIREINVDELLELAENIRSGKIHADKGIAGFPDYMQSAGIN
jgi:glutamate 5-kinase